MPRNSIVAAGAECVVSDKVGTFAGYVVTVRCDLVNTILFFCNVSFGTKGSSVTTLVEH